MAGGPERCADPAGMGAAEAAWVAGCGRVRGGAGAWRGLRNGWRRPIVSTWRVPEPEDGDGNGGGFACDPRAARPAAELQGVGAGGGDADADEQPGSGGRGAAGGSGGVRRDGPGGAELGGVRRDRADAAGAGERRDAADPVGEAGGGDRKSVV